MPQPRRVEQLTDNLLKLYAEAWERVVVQMQSITADPLQARKLRRLDTVRRSIEREMDQLVAPTRQWLERDFPKTYGLGAAFGAAGAGGTFDAFTTIHRDAVQRLAGTMFDDLLGATRYVKRDTKRFIRTVMRDEALKKAIEGRTATQAAREASRIIENAGIHAVRYRNGAKHTLKDYSEMAMRTTTAIAYNEGTVNGALAHDVQFFEIFDGIDCGLSFHEDPTLANGLIVDRATAQAFFIAHPRCRRSFGPRPDITSAKQAKAAKPSTTAAQRRDQARAEARRAEQMARRAATRATRARRAGRAGTGASERAERLRGREQKLGREARPEWQPTMTEAEAREWNRGTAFEGETFYHHTQVAPGESISAGGFNTSEGTYGRFIHLTDNPEPGTSGKRFSDTVLRTAVRAENPKRFESGQDFRRWVAERDPDNVLDPADILRAEGHDALVVPRGNDLFVMLMDRRQVTVLIDDAARASGVEQKLGAAVTPANRRVIPAPANFAMKLPDDTLEGVTELRKAIRENGAAAVVATKEARLKLYQAIRFEKVQVYLKEVDGRFVANVIGKAPDPPKPPKVTPLKPTPVVEPPPPTTVLESRLAARAEKLAPEPVVPVEGSLQAKVAQLRGQGVTTEAQARAIGQVVDDEIRLRMRAIATRTRKEAVEAVDRIQFKRVRDDTFDVHTDQGKLIGHVDRKLNGKWEPRLFFEPRTGQLFDAPEGAFEALRELRRARILNTNPLADYDTAIAALNRADEVRGRWFDEIRDLQVRLRAGGRDLEEGKSLRDQVQVLERRIRSGEIGPANYSDIQRDVARAAEGVANAYEQAAREVLGEIREFGRGRIAQFNVTNKQGGLARTAAQKRDAKELLDAMDQAQKAFPSDWLAQSGRHQLQLRPSGTVVRNGKKVKEGSYYQRLHRIVVDLKGREIRATAQHEATHHMEYSVRQPNVATTLGDLERAFWNRRTAPYPDGHRYQNDGWGGGGNGDDLFFYYAGRNYEMGLNARGRTEAWELLTTAMESVFGASSKGLTYQRLGVLADTEHLRFLLGILAAF